MAKTREPHKVRALQSFFELKVGDLVVHAVHGLARFAGLKRMERSGGEEEHLHLLFAEEVSLFVPASRIFSALTWVKPEDTDSMALQDLIAELQLFEREMRRYVAGIE